ncbi:MAG: 1-deoxy-D-xylulose-5-phosphate reductoisomerase [Candidatus Omnitrophica bacterium]|nr:1-deoxy-D-xylulose-5-phosphate reductoisomerase [Candidatus Omnitrophota bacterium]
MTKKKTVAILGSTGSIGINTLNVIRQSADRFRVVGLSADSNIGLLAKQAHDFRPKAVSVGRKSLVNRLKKAVPPGTLVLDGLGGLTEIACEKDTDIVVLAISGTVCLIPLIEAIKKGKAVALANKEALVSAGPLVKSLAQKHRAAMIPIDSEHSAIFQCINGKVSDVSKIYLTGSGGPLLDVPLNRFDRLSRKFILRHPRWRMGKKISVDSATMMNKGLEILEAKYLFGVAEKDIEVLIHPEAIVHSMVEFVDGSVLAQMAVADMRLPIQYALNFPLRARAIVERLDFIKIGALTFRKPDEVKFPCLGLARAAASSGGTAPAALCAADEEAVKCYLDGNIKFSRIAEIIEKVLSRHRNVKIDALSVKDILDTDRWAREEARSLCCL